MSRRGWLVAALGAALLVMGAACGGGDDDSGSASSTPVATSGATPSDPNARAAAAINAIAIPRGMADKLALGKPDAKVTLEVFEDFQCPNCLNYTATYEKLVIDEYVATGKIRLVFRNFPILGQESVQAAVAGYCAGEQGKFWEYHKKLFQVQAEAGQLTGEKLQAGRFSAEKLASYAQAVGLDSSAFGQCYSSDVAINAVRADYAAAQAAGIPGTPGFLLNGNRTTFPGSPDGWRQALDAAVAGGN